MDQIIEKEISETSTSLNQQHTQCQWYVQTYLLAISGLFAVAGFFGKDGKLSIQASSVGIVYAVIVFFLGWVFLSVVAHKAAMIHMLYKHIASMRALRINKHEELREKYVLPLEKNQIRYGSLITYLPYLFFIFNFIFLCSALTYFISPHFSYYQTVAIVCASATLFGTFYPVVCISFNKHLGCAFKANNARHRNLLEHIWTHAVKKEKRKYRSIKYILLAIANLGAIGVVVFALMPLSKEYTHTIIYTSYSGVLIFTAIRYVMEKYRIKIGVEAVRQKIE